MSEKQAVIYLRTSTGEQATSLDAQREKAEAYCQVQGLRVYQVIADKDVSAFIPLEKRKGGMHLMRILERGKAKHVVVLGLDRLFRNVLDAKRIIEDWNERGICLHLVEMGGQSINTKTAVGKLFLTLLVGFAEFERNLIAERTKLALEHKKSSRWHPRVVAYILKNYQLYSHYL